MNVCPAQVNLPDGTRHTRAKAAIVDGTLGVWTSPGSPAFVGQVAGVVDGRRRWTVTLDDGGEVLVLKGSGCSCASRKLCGADTSVLTAQVGVG